MRLAELWYASPAYQLLLRGPTPRHLSRLPPAPGAGDPQRGAMILGGVLMAGGHQVDLSPAVWRNPALPAQALADLHGFGWLDDLAMVGGERAAKVAQDLVDSWIDHNSVWSADAWSPAVVGMRLGAWLSHARLIAPPENSPLGSRILASLARQARHLQRVATTAEEGVGRILALRGLVYAIACGLLPRRSLGKVLHWLTIEIPRQIQPDGSHLSRSPRRQVVALAALIDVQNVLKSAAEEPPASVIQAIERMTPVVRFLCHGDGRFAQFNGGTEDSSEPIAAVLGASDADGNDPSAPDAGGYHRLAAGDSLVIMDCGMPPPSGFDGEAHAGTLSFEMSAGRERLIVNCGAVGLADEAARRAARSTAAHSTLTIDDRNSSEILAGDGLGRRPAAVNCSREEADGNAWLDASHDGYRSNFGVVHRRRLYLSRDGHDLRGEDTLVGAHRGEFAVRFHLHPDVDASLIQTGAAVLLRQRTGTAWRFQATGGRLDLAESIYLGLKGQRRSEQIVITGSLDGSGAQLKWALKRITA